MKTDERHSEAPTRRDLLQAAGLGLVGMTGLDLVRTATAQAPKAPDVPSLNRFGRMVQEYFVEQVRAAERVGVKARAVLKSKADAEAYVEGVRKKIRTSFGPFPEKTPLNARVTGVVRRAAYDIEKVIFESRPGFLVTANLYVPRGGKLPMPGVVGSCGHSVNGKAGDTYQAFAQGLARQGYVCLI